MNEFDKTSPLPIDGAVDASDQVAAAGDEMGQDREPIDLLADEFSRRRRQGDSITIEEFAAEHPDESEQILALFPAICAMERVKERQPRRADGRVSLSGVPARLGDYRLVREVGRGGMGVVYEAQQISLDRRVAVKVLPRQSLLSSKGLRRFHREARTAAQLHHTNIVPVFGVGEEGGYHYIVMQLIAGIGLDEVLRELVRAAGITSEVALQGEGGGGPTGNGAQRQHCQGKGRGPAVEHAWTGSPRLGLESWLVGKLGRRC